MPDRLNFTKTTLEKLPKAPPSKRVTYYDKKIPHLTVVVTYTGTKSFYLYRKVHGRPERILIGRFPAVTVEQARRKAQELNGAIAGGGNPSRQRRIERSEWTLKQLFEDWLEHHAKLHNRSWRDTEKVFNRYLTKKLERRKLSEIHRADIRQLHVKIGETAPYAANRLLALVSTIFNYARKELDLSVENPAQGVRRFREKSRDRFLQRDEMQKFFNALGSEPNQDIRDYVLLSLLTGARKQNVLAMRWEELALDRAEWRIPQTKSGDSHTVPLMPEAVDILKGRQKKSDREYVFPSTGRTGHLVEVKKPWKRLLERAGIEDLRLHDLRRTLGSWQAATGASLSVIGKTLAHKNVATTAIYSRLNLDPVRASVETATRAMFDAAGLLPKAEVVDMKQGKRR